MSNRERLGARVKSCGFFFLWGFIGFLLVASVGQEKAWGDVIELEQVIYIPDLLPRMPFGGQAGLSVESNFQTLFDSVSNSSTIKKHRSVDLNSYGIAEIWVLDSSTQADRWYRVFLSDVQTGDDEQAKVEYRELNELDSNGILVYQKGKTEYLLEDTMTIDLINEHDALLVAFHQCAAFVMVEMFDLDEEAIVRYVEEVNNRIGQYICAPEKGAP